ncbi:MAG: hypothetical protein WCD89_00320, partial [Anaerocolumna sp.]
FCSMPATYKRRIAQKRTKGRWELKGFITPSVPFAERRTITMNLMYTAKCFRADGKYGQFSIVVPDKRAIIIITAHNEVNSNDILRAVWSEILPLL